MASTLFEEDVVQRCHRSTMQLGLVVRNYDGYSSMDDSEDDEERIKRGYVRVAWYPKGRENVLPEKKVSLYDRSLMPGDAVRCNQEGSQRGIVRSVHVSCHLQVIRTKQMIYDVCSQYLENVMMYTPGCHVVLGSWIGVVRNIHVKLVVRLKNGARCILSEDSACRLTDIHDTDEEASVFSCDSFFPGQVLRGPAMTFKNATWLSGQQPILSSKANFTVTVEEVNVVKLDVHWQTRGLCRYPAGDCTDSNQLQPPPRKITGDILSRIRPLSYFIAASIQIGDKVMYRVQPGDLAYPKPVSRGTLDCYVQPSQGEGGGESGTAKDADCSLEAPMPQGNTNEELRQTSQPTTMNSGGNANVELGASAETGFLENNEQCMSGLLTTQSSNKLAENDTKPSSGQCEEGDTLASEGKAAASEETKQIDVPEGGATKLSLGACATVSETATEIVSSALQEMLDFGNEFVSNHSNLSKRAKKGDFEKWKPSKNASEDKDELLARAEELKVGLSRDVDLLGELHRELCDASDSVTDIAKNFRTLLQRATNESAGIISGQVSSLLESQGKLRQQILMTEGLLVDSKRSLKELDDIEMETRGATASGKTAGSKSLRKVRAQAAKSRSRRRLDDDRDSNQSSDNAEDDEVDSSEGLDDSDETDSNASSKGESRRHKVVSSLLHRHTKKQHIRLASKRRPPPKPLELKERVCVEVTHTRTLVDVMWQDGTLQKGVVSTDLFPDHQLDELEFFPGDFVTKNNEDLENVYGLVCKTDHKERTCLVQWIMRPNQQCNTPKPIHMEEVSVYELTPHPDFTFNVGDVIVRIADSRHGITALKKAKPDPKATHPAPQMDDLDTQVGSNTSHMSQAGSHTDELNTQLSNQSSYVNQVGTHAVESGTHAVESGTQVGDSDTQMGNNINPVGNPGSNTDLCGTQVNSSDTQISIPSDHMRTNDTTMDNQDVPLGNATKRTDVIIRMNKDNQLTETKQSRTNNQSSQRSGPSDEEQLCSTQSDHLDEGCARSQGTANHANAADMATVNRMNLANLQTIHAEMSDDALVLEDKSASKIEHCQETEAVSCAGQVRWINTNGEIHVAWVDGSECSVLPQDLYKLEEDSDSDWSDTNHEDEDWKDENQSDDSWYSSSSSWETASDASGSAEEKKATSRKNPSSLPTSPDKEATTPTESRGPTDFQEATFEQTFSALSLVEDKMRRINSCANSILEKRTDLLQRDLNSNSRKEAGASVAGLKEEELATTSTRNDESKVTNESADTRDRGTQIETQVLLEPDVSNLDDVSESNIAEAGSPDSSIVLEKAVAAETAETASTSEVEESKGEQNHDNNESCQMSATEGAAQTVTGQACDNFFLMDDVPETHHFNTSSVVFLPENPKQFSLTMRREMRLLQTALPQGIKVKGFADRMDLFSVLFEGPSSTPYEDGLFFFDARLPQDYPKSPPVLHFHAYCSGRLNPNLYNDGKVCVSLLGTWTGKGSEMWTSKSNLLQVLVSIQGLILVSEPYYNEAGYEKQRGTQSGNENSRLYNETAALKMVQSMTLMLTNPPDVFHEETLNFCRHHGFRLIKRIEHWLTMAGTSSSQSEEPAKEVPGKMASGMKEQGSSDAPAFILLPLSKGFILSMRQALRAYRAALGVAGIPDS
ncbi:(E3-independent) E2 ubiquitin-conjugating enzyme-like [Patiria miniata]|uniref:UBC core domain-containing protein n=1 Tax=Patiria miniata TaxID=46514 RepID=A0A914AJU1_PATMI|nr:(E3-independent) E2 ubiquitin-conjugating enzyme-like [Patiria miniata]